MSIARVFLTVPLFALCSCAQVREPTGGPKDERPPALLAAEPPNQSIGFSGQRIVLHFDERVQVGDLVKRAIISPPLRKPPRVQIVRGRSVVLDLDSALEPATTYNFQLGEAITDLSEGNTAKGFAYVVSTGSALDSAWLAGKVVNAATGGAEKDVLVLLHAAGDTAAFRSGRPRYFTRTDANGHFRLEHLRADRYEVFALRDQNGSFNFDLPNEDMAFLDRAVQPSQDTAHMDSVLLCLYREPATTLQMLDARVLVEGAFRVILSRPATSWRLFEVGLTGAMLKWQWERCATGDTLLAWPSDTTALQGRFFALEVDSIILDTLTYSPVGRVPFYLGASLAEVDGYGAVVRANRPVDRVDTARMELKNSQGGAVGYTAELDSTHRLLRIRYPSTADDLVWTALPKAMRDLFGGVNDTLRLTLARTPESELCKLGLNISSTRCTTPILVELLDAQGNAVCSAHLPPPPATVKWERVVPGTYKLRVVLDKDANGRWTPGHWKHGRLPEQVLVDPVPVVARAGWEISLEKDLDKWVGLSGD
jgi:Bacterial Ig-like domain